MFNFQKTPKTIPEEHKTILTEIIDNRDKSDLMVRCGDYNIGKIYYCHEKAEWRYISCGNYYSMASMPASIGQDSMRIILSKLTELNEQELNYE